VPHVTIDEITPRTTFTITTASSGPFTIPAEWGFFALTDFRVFNATLGTELTYDASPADNTEFSVSGNAVDGGYQGGTFTLGGTLTSTTLILERNVRYAREDDFPYPSSTLNILSLNTALDKFAAWAQQIVSRITRTLRQPDADTATIGALPTKADRLGMFLYFNATTGDPEAAAGTTEVPVSAAMEPVVGAASLSAARAAMGLAIGPNVLSPTGDGSGLTGISGLTIDATPDADVTAEGMKATFTAGENLVFGDVCYMKSDGKMWKADADAASTMPAVAMAIATIAADANGLFLLHGVARQDSWNWTVGGAIYASVTAGGLSQTAVSGTSDCHQVIGYATHADRMLFMPSPDFFVVTA